MADMAERIYLDWNATTPLRPEAKAAIAHAWEIGGNPSVAKACGLAKLVLSKPGVERVMRAVAQAHLRTGAPITVHTAPQAQTGLIVQQVLSEEGVDLEDVIIGHCGDTDDLDYLMKLADRGSILGMDRFGINFTITPQQRVKTIAEMVRRGYAAQLTLSHDCCCWSDYFPTVEDYNRAMPDHHYLHIHQEIIPALRDAGVGEADLDRMFVENPRRHFEAAAKRFAARR